MTPHQLAGVIWERPSLGACIDGYDNGVGRPAAAGDAAEHPLLAGEPRADQSRAARLSRARGGV